MRAFFQGAECLPICYPLVGQKAGSEKASCLKTLTRTLFTLPSPLTTSSDANYLAKAPPPNTITWRGPILDDTNILTRTGPHPHDLI